MVGLEEGREKWEKWGQPPFLERRKILTIQKRWLSPFLIQTDAAINPGNSGCPLLDFAGRAVGVNVATVIGSENIGFALPINELRDILSTALKR